MFDTIAKKIRSGKKGVNIELTLPHNPICPIDVEDAVKELSLQEAARQDAEKGLPRRRDAFPSASEANVQNYVSERINDYVQWGDHIVKYHDATMHGAEIQNSVILDYRNVVSHFEEQDIKSWSTEFASELSHRRRQWESARKGLEDFRKANALMDPPKNKSAQQRWWALTMLAFLVLVESAVNAGIFAKGLSGGLAGGLFMAFANIFLSCGFFALLMGGEKVRCPRGTSYRVWGIAVCAIWFAAELFFSYGVVHYREALTELAASDFELEVDAAVLAARNFFTPLTDLLSWGLWALTVIFGLMAFLDGVFWREPFPGYTHRWETAEELRLDYLELYLISP